MQTSGATFPITALSAEKKGVKNETASREDKTVNCWSRQKNDVLLNLAK